MRKAAILLLIALVLPFSACGKAEPFTQESESAPEETAVSLPDAMPEDFAVRFETWFVPERKNVLDTFEGKIEKDLVEDGRAEAVFTPSEPLREELYETIRESGIASIRRSMTSHVLATGDERVSCEPLSCWRAWFYRETVPDAGRFAAFCEKMNELLRSLPEFRALPEPRGAYE